MLKLRKVAITGGLSSGKSTVCQYLKELGAYVISADSIVHGLLSQDTEIIQEVIQTFSKEIAPQGVINRKRLAQEVFNNPEKLQHLENILHPKVLDAILQHYHIASERKEATLFVAEVPLLYETGMDQLFDFCISLDTPETICQRWFKGSIEEFNQRSQRLYLPKQRNADVVLSNEGTKQELRKKVKKLFNQLQQL